MDFFADGRLSGAYCGPPPPPQAIWSSWNLDPPVLAALVLLSLATRRDHAGQAGVAVLALAFASPLCALSSALFSARVLHHVLLVAVAAPLLARALPPARPRPGLALPFAAATVTLWLWHLPAAYDLALAQKAVYWAMQASLLATALAFWRAVLAPSQAPVAALIAIVAGFAQMGMLGALLTFAADPLYAAHAVAPRDWGLSPLADQQLGGLLMWVPAGLPYAVAAIALGRGGWARLRGGAA